MIREDDFSERRKKLSGLSDAELEARFWSLTDEIMKPLIDLAKTHTSPSIERSVLLRMGFSSIEAKAIADRCAEKGLLGKGAGHAVWKVAQDHKIPIRTAGLELAEGKHWDNLIFGK
ncbi:MAG TPA: ornithine aminomutase [Firmicutes bacterium]|jgi:D-ornithine 4,5-aminomutase subunit alpha|nr:ornithine aminomutase [Bacillota bacterium]HBR24198.1 ornithine aminomutase [Bacillota bacterium]